MINIVSCSAPNTLLLCLRRKEFIRPVTPLQYLLPDKLMATVVPVSAGDADVVSVADSGGTPCLVKIVMQN